MDTTEGIPKLLKVFGFFSRLPSEEDKAAIISEFFGGVPLDLEIFGPGDEAKVKDKWAWTGPRAVLVGSGGTEPRIVKFLTEMGDPPILFTIPRENSLSAAMEIAAWLRSSGKPFMLAQGRELKSRCLEIIEASRVMNSLCLSNAGLIGKPSEWLPASAQDPFEVENRWGVKILQLPATILDDFSGPKSGKIPEEVAGEFREIFKKVFEANGTRGFASAVKGNSGDNCSGEEGLEEALSRSLRVYSILKETIGEKSLDAVGVNCFSLTRQGTTACLALAALNSIGIPAACEADVSMLVSMMAGRLISGKPGFMANVTEIDGPGGVLRLSHCTIDPSMTDGYCLDTHFESRAGLAMRGKLPVGARVTVFRLGGPRLEDFFAAEGVITGNPQDRTNCRTSVNIEIAASATADLLVRPLGNHHLVLPGCHAEAIGFLMKLRNLVLNDIYRNDIYRNDMHI